MVKNQEAQEILRSLGLPPKQQNEQAAFTLLVLCGLKPRSTWKSAKRVSLGIHGMLQAMASDWGKTYAENTRETVRRQVVHQLEQARVVDRNPDEPTLPTNSPRTHYALTAEALECIRAYGTPSFQKRVKTFQKKHGSLLSKYRKERKRHHVAIQLPDGTEELLSPGKHNELERAIVEEFRPRFGPKTELVYLGDTANKAIYRNDAALKDLKLKLSDHDKLPDVILWDQERNWLFLMEAVTSHGPVTPKRETELRKVFEKTRCGLIFLTAFPDYKEFKRHLDQIAWETEVWIAEMPDHLIHFNGDRFLQAYENQGI